MRVRYNFCLAPPQNSKESDNLVCKRKWERHDGAGGGGWNKHNPWGSSSEVGPPLGLCGQAGPVSLARGHLFRGEWDRSHGVGPTSLNRMCVTSTIPQVWLVPKSGRSMEKQNKVRSH